MKKSLFMCGMLTFFLTVCIEQHVSAQMAIRTTEHRDNLLLSSFLEYPYYVVAIGNEHFNEIMGGFVLKGPLIEGAQYAVSNGSLVVSFQSPIGPRALMITLARTKEEADIIKASFEKETNFVLAALGPFGGDSSENARMTSLKCILNAIQIYIKSPNNFPKVW